MRSVTTIQMRVLPARAPARVPVKEPARVPHHTMDVLRDALVIAILAMGKIATATVLVQGQAKGSP